MSVPFVLFKVAHVVSVVVGFGPLFVYPFVLRRSGVGAVTVEAVRAARGRISEPAFFAVGPLGLLAAIAHPDEDVFARLWVRLAIPLWLFAVAVVLILQRPLAARVSESARAVADGDASRVGELRRRVVWLTRVTWISWAGLVGMVLLMVTRPA